MHEESIHPLPTPANGTRGRALRDPGALPEVKPLANSPAIRGAAKTALIQLIDGQIAARRGEIDELTRIRHMVLDSGRMYGG